MYMYMSTVKLHVDLCDFVRKRDRDRERRGECMGRE